jgi:hypothetical protein
MNSLHPDRTARATDRATTRGRKRLEPGLPRLALAAALAAWLGATASPLAAGFGPSTTCVSNRPGGNNCTSNDLTFVLIGLGVQSDGCVNETDNVTIQLGARIRNSTAQTRYDVGIFIDRNNASAYSGTNCAVETLHPLGATGNFSCTSGSPPLELNDFPTGDGPFLDTDGDACGDLQNQSGTGCDVNPVDGSYDDSFIRLPALTLSCRAGAPTNDGFVRIASCLTWGNNDDQVGALQGGSKVCDGTNPEDDVHAGTNAKCRCDDSQVSDIPLPNFRLNCDSFNQARTLANGQTATFNIDYTNSVPGCTPGSFSDPFGRFKCGTASFLRVVVDYDIGGVNAEDHGNFYVNNDLVNPIPACTSVATLSGGAGVVCNDTTNRRLIFAPQDSSSPFALGVVSPFSGTRTLPFQYTKTDAFAGTITFTSRVTWDDLLDTNSDSSISTAEAVTIGGSSMVQTASNTTCTSTPAATPVTLAAFSSERSGREVRLDWATDTEVGNVGFHLYALVGGERVRLDAEPVPAAGGDGLEPRHYTAHFRVPDLVDGFLVEDIDLHGRGRVHGPFAPGRRYGVAVDPPRIDWGAVRRDHRLAEGASGREIRAPRARRAANRTASAALLAAAPTGPIDLRVNKSGLHRVTYEQLYAAGLDLATSSSSQLGLSLGGKQVPIHVQAGARFGPGSWFEFWGEALDTLYTSTNVYRLRTGVKRPARATVSTAAPSGSAAASYVETRPFERNLGYAYWSAGADPFFDTQMLVFGSPNQWQFPFAVDGLVAGGGAATLHVEFFGATSFAGFEPDHHVEFLLNGVQVGESFFDGASYRTFDVTLPSGLLVEGANTLTLRLPGDTGAPFDMQALESFAVSYPRAFAAVSGRLDFAGGSGRYEVTGLASSDLVAYRRDATALVRLAGTSVVPDGGGFRAIVPGTLATASYSVATAAALLAPAAIVPARPPADLAGGPASYLVIANAGFLDGLGALVAARQAQGWTVKVVDVEDIYAQYSGGVFDAHAIRDYLAWAHRNLGTRAVLLVGGDTYDYRNYLGLAPVSFVPSLYRATHEVVRYAPSDASYADVDGDGVQDLAIGRFPVRTGQELANLIDKTLGYEARSYLGVGAVAADATDPNSSEPFSSVADGFVDVLDGGGWQVDPVYVDALGLAAAKSRLLADLAAGASLVAFVGHSGQTSWGTPTVPIAQRLLTTNDVPTLGNPGLPTAIVQFGCWNSYYNHPTVESLGNRLVLVAERGAAAAMGTATLTSDANNNRFSRLLAPFLASPGTALGDAVVAAKRALAAQAAETGIDVRDILAGWTLLGDPALVATP